MHRAKKENLLKQNLDICINRALREHKKATGKDMPGKERAEMIKEFRQMANHIDKEKLSYVWND